MRGSPADVPLIGKTNDNSNSIERPEFAPVAGMAALRGIARGDGYDLTGVDILDAYAAVMQPAAEAGVAEAVVKADVLAMIAGSGNGGEFVQRILARQLAG